MVFLQLRQQTETVQGVVALSKEGEEEVVSKQMIKWVNGVSVSAHEIVGFEIERWGADVRFVGCGLLVCWADWVARIHRPR